MKICINNYRDDLYCVSCKELILIGQKYIIFEENYMGDTITKEYHVDHVPVIDETDTPYIAGE